MVINIMVVRQRPLVRVTRDFPLRGTLNFGLIDRGTNLIQVRPMTGCIFSCIFCSVDEGPRSRTRYAKYTVEDWRYLVEELEELIREKGINDVEAHIDGAADPAFYPHIRELIEGIAEIPEVSVISMQSRGIDEHLALKLVEAGLSRLNLSIDAMDPSLAAWMNGVPVSIVERSYRVARAVANSEGDLLIAPVWVPGINDSEMEKIIKFAKEIGAGKRWPPLGIQKFEAHKRGRKPKGIKEMSWREFYAALSRMESRYNVKLILKKEDFEIHPAPTPPPVFRRYEKVRVELLAPGWMKNEMIGKSRDRIVTVVGLRPWEAVTGAKITVRIIHNKHGIYIGKP